MAPSAAHADVGYDNFQFCNYSSNDAYVDFNFTAVTSTIVQPGTCFQMNVSTFNDGFAFDDVIAHEFGYGWDAVVDSLWYDPQADWVEFDIY
jgi:hypothetical protein